MMIQGRDCGDEHDDQSNFRRACEVCGLNETVTSPMTYMEVRDVLDAALAAHRHQGRIARVINVGERIFMAFTTHLIEEGRWFPSTREYLTFKGVRLNRSDDLDASEVLVR